MRFFRLFMVALMTSSLLACSLPPDQPVTRKALGRSGIYRTYKIVESPEEVLNALNMEGEVILRGESRDRPVYIKVLVTSDGLEVTSFDR